MLSIRLANWRAGAEDHALLSMLRHRDARAAERLAEMLVTNSIHHMDEHSVLEGARREAAAALLAP